MPPRIRTSSEDIINAAFEITRREGISSVTAQSISKELGTSVAPIFRVFKTVEEVKRSVISYLEQYFITYLKNFPKEHSQFLTYGLAYISFGQEEPFLFDALLSSNLLTFENVSESLNFLLDSIPSMDHESAKELFTQIWIYSHGLACLTAKKGMELSKEKAVQMLTSAMKAFENNRITEEKL